MIGFTETVLRDANQSLIATRLPYDKFKDILSTMDNRQASPITKASNVLFENGQTGLIHISEISSKYFAHCQDPLKIQFFKTQGRKT